MTKITFVIADLGSGGAQRVMTLLANEFVCQQDWQIQVVSLSAPGEGSFFSLNPGVELHFAALNGVSGGLISGVLSNLRRLIILRGILRKLQPDIVVSFLTETNCRTLLAAAGLRIPIIVSERSDPRLYPEKVFWRVLRRLIYPLSAHLVCQTKYVVDYFSYLARKSVIYNPVSVSEAVGVAPCLVPYILGAGRLAHEKGFDILIEAHALVIAQGIGLKLVLAGEGPDREELERLVRRQGTSPHVIFAGVQHDLSGYYRQAIMFVLPSRFEGMPNALLEAMAYGCPVVVTPDFRAAGEIVTHGHNGLIALHADPAALSEEIISLYNNPDKRHALGMQGKNDSDRFRSYNIAAQWRVLIMQILH